MNRFLVLSIIAITLVACNKDDDFVPKAEVSNQTLQFSQNGGDDSLTITSNTNWIIEKDAEWISLSKASGSSDAIVVVSAVKNTDLTPRTATLTVIADGLPDIQITVNQSGVDKLEVDRLSLQFSPNSSVDSFAVTSNVSWTIEKDAEWLTLSKVSGSSDEVIKVSVAENTALTSRTATVTVKSDGLPDIQIEVNQSKALETTGLFILNENFFPDSISRISYYDVKTGVTHKNYFFQKNGKELGYGANDLAIYGSKLYCVVGGVTEGHIEVINPETGISIKRVSVKNEDGTNSQPRSITFHENKAYITTYSQKVIRLDTASLNIDGTANLSGTYTEGICLYNDNLYVCNSGWGSGNTISVVSLSSFTETGTITVPSNPMSIKATASGEIYFTTAGWSMASPSNLHLLNPEQKQVTTLDVRASKLALTKDFIYAVDFFYGDYADHISKINLQTKEVTDVSDMFGDYYMVYDISVNPLNGDIYLTDQGQNVVVFDKDGNETLNLKTGVNITSKVVPVIR